MTSGWSLSMRASAPGASQKQRADKVMMPAPPANAVRPERRAAGVSRAPTAQPTRTVPAMPTPTAAQKVKLASEMATWCAARLSAPRRPAKRPTSAKTPTSAPICRPTGIPTESALRRSLALGAWRAPGRTAKARMPNCSKEQMLVARPEPGAPSAGRPSLPKTSTTSRQRFATLASTVATISARSCSRAWR